MFGVNAGEVKAKMQDKRECYHFCTHELGLYLPSYDTVTVWHLRDLITSKRAKIKSTLIQHYDVPQYDGLGIKEFVEFANDYPLAMEAFPLERSEIYKMPRQYIINVINIQVGAPFRVWVTGFVNRRH